MIRKCIFRPYRKGQGPVFTLSLIDDDTFRDGRYWIHYRLRMKPVVGKSVMLFEGNDFGSSPLHGTDSDESVSALMGFLTVRPGDTDAEYFDSYTQEQLAYCDEHAESLGLAVCDRFGFDK